MKIDELEYKAVEKVEGKVSGRTIEVAKMFTNFTLTTNVHFEFSDGFKMEMEKIATGVMYHSKGPNFVLLYRDGTFLYVVVILGILMRRIS